MALDGRQFAPGVRVWRARLDEYAVRANCVDSVSSAELERSGRFIREIDRRRFLARRTLLREILGRECGLPPLELEFSATATGKPRLRSGTLRFSTSSSSDVFLVAVASCDVGVDVEGIREVDFESLTSWLAPEERRGIDDREDFFRIWCRKEAVVKCSGEGLGDGFTRFAVSADEDPRFLRDDRDHAGPSPSLRDLDVAPGFAAAVAHHGASLPVRLIDHESWTPAEVLR